VARDAGANRREKNLYTAGQTRPRGRGLEETNVPQKLSVNPLAEILDETFTSALQIFWADGHADGLYTYQKLREWGENPPELPPLTTAFPLLPVR